MKSTIFFLVLLGMFNLNSKDGEIESKVYSFSKTSVEKTDRGELRQLMNGETTHMENFEIRAITINPDALLRLKIVDSDHEEILFVKEGQLEVSLSNESKIVGPGSVALILPGDQYSVEPAGNKPVTYFQVKYKSKLPINISRGETAGGSLIFNWDSLKFQPHDRGGQRSFFDRSSSMSERIEMHATTLNPAIKSHEPHIHGPAEIVIMMSGTTEMEIGANVYQGAAGDIYFLGSDIPHAIRNTGTEACTYLAFQWE